MKGGTSFLIAMIIVLASSVGFAQSSICERIFEQAPLDDEYLPFPLIDESFFEGAFSESVNFYSPEASLNIEVSHLMGAEYLVRMTRVWDGKVGRGVLVYSQGNFAGFVQHEGRNVLLDLGAITENGATQYYIQLDNRCYRAELEASQLR